MQNARTVLGAATILLFAVGSLLDAVDAEKQPEVTALQRQIDELKQQLQQFDKLKAQLAELEEKLRTLQEKQKSADQAEAQSAKERKVDGYVQLRWSGDETSAGHDEFGIRRARMNLRGSLSEKTSYRFELQMESKEKGGGPGSKLQLRTANIDYLLGDGRLRFGQAKIPWGYELEVSSAELWSGERSLFMDRLFPNQRDIGLQYQWTAAKNRATVDVGLFNGTGINANDDNSRKDPVARLRIPFHGGSAALSYYDGRNDSGDAAGERDRLGIGVQAEWRQFSFMGELVKGEDRGADVAGWYAQLGYRLPANRGMIFIKPDWFDEDRDLPNDSFRRTTIGYLHDLDARTRLTLAYELRSVDEDFSEFEKWNGDAGWLQLQIRY